MTRLEPRLTPEKIEHIAKVDRGEKFAPAFTDREMIERVENEIVCLKTLTPVAVVTGSYVTIPVTCRVLQIPLVWVVQSTWLPDFFCHGAGMTDHIRPAPLKALADWFILRFINFWIRYGFLNPVNRAAKHFGVPGYDSIFEFWRGDITLVAEPPEFSGVNAAAQPLLHRSAHSAGRIPDARGTRSHSAGQAADLLCDGKLRAHQRSSPGSLKASKASHTA